MRNKIPNKKTLDEKKIKHSLIRNIYIFAA
jgi:hypothetical protein